MKRWVPTREKLRESRWLRPLAHHLDKEHLWSTERGSVARAVSIGIFVGLLLPVAQFVVAVVVAIALRSHVAIAATATLITNPFTFPPIYWLAYRIGDALRGVDFQEAEARRIEAEAGQVAADQGFFEGLLYTVQSAGPSLLLGLLVMAVVGALVAFALVWLLWRPGRSVDTTGADH
jgi:uncharacterized protein (DUF2062 family)